MNFDLTEEQVLLKNMVERFVADRYDLDQRRAYQAMPLGFSPENWSMLAELGLLALPFPSDLGGLDGGPVELLVVMEALGRGLVVEPVLGHVVLPGDLLIRAGTDEQKAEILPGIMSGERHVTLAHAETGARYNLAHVETRAAPEGNSVRLTGRKIFTLSGKAADLFIVSARGTDSAQIEFYLVPADAPGLERRSFRLADGSLAAEIELNGVTVPASARLADGLEALTGAVATTRLGACAQMLGIMGSMFDATLEYLRTRKQFGAPIGSFQALQHRMAQLYALTEQSRSLVYGAALADEASREKTIAGAKAYVSEAALRVGHECIQFHGGMGVSDELAIGHGHKQLLVLANLLGDAESTLEEFIQRAA